ncbi:SDR family oxidoreductase [Pelobacter seleniigenes]|uniref:SDR family oxidoreductase n=1 Tax=Pelobacter seleniigenes TaxID=407188 RepID=UPI0004A73550|nr:SDR family oxidoreductase [Pelobacter seleniigenes]
MKKILLLGANGKIGQLLTRLLVKEDLPFRVMVRTPEQIRAFNELGVEAVLGDLESDFSTAFEDCDKVVFSAGSGGATGADKTLLVDLWGAIKTVNYAKEKGLDHVVMISSMNAADPDKGPAAIKHYLVAKFAADEYLKNSALPYSILRPARLTDEPGTGKVSINLPATPDERIIPRADVAAAALYCLANNSTKGLIVNLRQGNMNIEEALER